MSEDLVDNKRMNFPLDFLRRAMLACFVVNQTMLDGTLRPHLYGIHLRQMKTRWRVAATNGHWLVAIERPTSIVGELPPGLDDGVGSFMFPAQKVRRFCADLKASLDMKEEANHTKNYAKRSAKMKRADWVSFDLEEMEATHFAGKFCLPEEDPGAFPNVVRVVSQHDKHEGGRDPNGVSRISISSMYLGAVNQVFARFLGHSPTNPRHASRLATRIYTGKDGTEPILFKPVPGSDMFDPAIAGSDISITVMPIKDDDK